MANSKHIEWLCESVQAWNERRKREDFEPNLEGADIPEEFGKGGGLVESSEAVIRQIRLGKFDDVVDLSGIDLSGAKLCNAILTNVNLSNANLRCADLKGCELDGAILENAELDFANLRGASASGANFKGAGLVGAKLDGADTDFSGADFSNAILAEAKLGSTNLVHALLFDANLSRTQLWNAVLFSEDTTAASEEALSKERISKVTDLLDVCSEVRGKYGGEDVLLYFRGESCGTWDLCPSVKREEHLRKAEAKMLVDLMSRRPEEFAKLNSVLAQWVLAQHHGLPTRLLDITRNPLVALFHACRDTDKCGRLHVFAVSRDLVKPFNNDTIAILTNFAKLAFDDQQLLLTEKGYGDAQSAIEFPRAMNRLYHLIRQEKPHFQKQIDPRDLFRVFVVEPQQSFERIRAQSGAFLISAFHDRFERSEILKQNKEIPVYDHYTLEVPDTKKRCLFDELLLLNITRETLLPGLDEAAKAVTRLHSKKPADGGIHGK